MKLGRGARRSPRGRVHAWVLKPRSSRDSTEAWAQSMRWHGQPITPRRCIARCGSASPGATCYESRDGRMSGPPAWPRSGRTRHDVCSRSREADIEVEIADGNAAPVLIDRSTPESLVVVGSRGRGVFDAIPVGSVPRAAKRYAGGPVVVVRETETPSSRRVVVGADDLPEGLAAVGLGSRLRTMRETWTCAWCTPRIRPCPSPALTPRGCLSTTRCCGSGRRGFANASSGCEKVTRV